MTHCYTAWRVSHPCMTSWHGELSSKCILLPIGSFLNVVMGAATALAWAGQKALLFVCAELPLPINISSSCLWDRLLNCQTWPVGQRKTTLSFPLQQFSAEASTAPLEYSSNRLYDFIWCNFLSHYPSQNKSTLFWHIRMTQVYSGGRCLH